MFGVIEEGREVSKPSNPQVELLISLIAGSVPEGVFVQLDVDLDRVVSDLPQLNIYGVGSDVRLKTGINPAIVLILSKESAHFYLETLVFVDGNNNFRVELSFQHWSTIAGYGEYPTAKKTMSRVLGYEGEPIKRVSVFSMDSGRLVIHRGFNQHPLGVDLPNTITKIVGSISQFGSTFFTVQTRIGKPSQDSFFTWKTKG